MRRVAVLVLTAGLIAAACGSDDDASSVSSTSHASTPATSAAVTTTSVPSTTTVPADPAPAWAAPMVEYIEALFGALNDGDAARLFPYFEDTAVLWPDTSRSRDLFVGGPRQLLAALDSVMVGTLPMRRPRLHFVAWGPGHDGTMQYWANVLHTADYGDTGLCSTEPCELVESIAIGGRGGTLFEFLGSTLVTDLRRNPLGQWDAGEKTAADPLLHEIESQYFELADAWSTHDVERILGTEGGVAASPGDAATVEAMRDILAAGFAAWPDSWLEPVTLADLGLRADADPVVFYRADGDPFDLEDEIGGFGVYRLHLDDEVSVLAGVRWLRRSGVVAHLDVIYEMESIDATAAYLGLPLPEPGDWPEVPVIERVLTGTVTIPGGHVVEVYNAEPPQQRLLEWALGRYEEAGLPVPAPRSVGFPPDLRCAVVAGIAVDTGEGADLQLCVTADEVCVGEGCEPSAVSRSTMLHELGHVWTNENSDETDRQRFLEFRELEVWTAPGADRDLLGTEHAAEILSWGLMDEETWGARLPDSECEALAAAFEVLTGLPPLRDCDTA